MIRMDLYHRQFQVRKFAEMATDKHFGLLSMSVPRGTTFHYLPENETVTGPDASDPVLTEIDRNIYVEHVHRYIGPTEGRMRELPFNEERDVKEFHRRHRLLRRSKKRETSVRDDKSLLVVNYAPIQHHYLYIRTFRTVYQKWVNMHTTLVATVMEHLKTTDRLQFLRIEVPDKLPTLTALRKVAKEGWTTETLKAFDTPEALNVVDAYLMLDPESNQSVYDRIPKEHWSRVNMIWRYQDRWFSISLETLKGFTYETEGDDKERDVEGVRKRFLALLMTLQEAGRGQSSATEVVGQLSKKDEDLNDIYEDDVEDEESAPTVPTTANKDEEDLDALDDVKVEDEPVTETVTSIRKEKTKEPDSAFMEVADSLAEEGRLSGAEYRRAKKLAEKYKSVKHPLTKEPLETYARVTPEDLAVESEVLAPPSTGIPDDSMRMSSINKVRNQYVDKVMNKDIANHVLSLQRMGASVTEYDIERHEDAGGAYDAHTVRLQPLTGSPSTLRFKLPVVDEDGSFTANGIKQYMRWQRGDLPIRKTAPDKVALTSYYGKAFVERSDKVAYDYGSWLVKSLIGIGLDDQDSRISNIKLGNVFRHDFVCPRVYSTLAKKMSRLTAKGIVLYLDRQEVEKVFKDDLDKIEKSGWIIVGKKGSTPILMQTSEALGTLYLHTDKAPEEIGAIEDLVGLDVSKAPVDVAELKLFSNSLPLGVALSYLMGFKGLCRTLGVKYRTVASGERAALQPHEYSVRFSNESYIFPKEDLQASLLINGLNQYKRLIERYSSREFEKKDVYKNMLEHSGLGVRYARELDLMDKMFIDPITLDILKERNEPETFRGLLFMAVELLLRDEHPAENDLNYQRIRGYERMTGAVYQELVRAARGYAMNPNSRKAKFEMNPEAVWYGVLSDPSVNQSKGNNPISQLRETEDVTFSGVGGRSTRSMVERTRHYHHSDLGVISEATVDSGKVGSTIYLSADPNFTSVRGITRPRKDEDGPTKHFSTTMMLTPASDKDDVKRTVFSSIQYGSTVAAKGYAPPIIRTGMERMIAHRTSDLFAQTAEQSGKVVSVTDTVIEVQFKDGSTKAIEIGRRYGTGAGLVFPHSVVTPLKAGQSFKAGEVLSYNTGYFDPDPMEPGQLLLKTTALAKTVLWESPDTLEDSSAISSELAARMGSTTTKLREIVVDFDTLIRNPQKVGSEVDYDDVLCLLEEPTSAAAGDLSSDALDTLKKIASKAPKAKFAGKVERIEVLYNGELSDMSESLAVLAKSSDKRIRAIAKAKKQAVTSGRVGNNMRVGGNELSLNTAVLKFYITGPEVTTPGSKLVFGHQLKSVIRDVVDEPILTEDGERVDAIFGYVSIDNRIVNSPALIGTAALLMDEITKRAVAMYFES